MDEQELAAQWEQQVDKEIQDKGEEDIQEDKVEVEEKVEENKQDNGAEEKKADFQQLKATDRVSGMNNLDFILEVPLHVSVHIGSTRMLIKDLLQLGQGSIIELNKFAGEPMDVFVNDKLIAKGEVVVVNDKFGIRLTDILSPRERVEQLK